MKMISVPCEFNGVTKPFNIYIGLAQEGFHPLHFQIEYLSQLGGRITQAVLDSIIKLEKLAERNNVSLEDLCVYALSSYSESKKHNEEDNS